MSRSSLADFAVLGRLGSGSYGTVFKVRRKADGQVYVSKAIRIAELAYKEQMDAIKEVQLLAEMDSPFIVRYYDSFVDGDSLHIVMEHCERGDLSRHLRRAGERGAKGLAERHVWSVLVQIALGLHYLHSKRILHRDMKSANVFLTARGAAGVVGDADADAAAGGAGAGQWFPLTVGEACQLLGAFKDGARAADIAASALAAGWQADPGARHAAGEPFQPLRAGWKAKWSRDYCCWYFEETGTGASSWERPTDGDAAR